MNLSGTNNDSVDDEVEMKELQRLLSAAEEMENGTKLSDSQKPPPPPKPLYQSEDLDSSDDEEIKNFLERKYNEYGRDINKKIKQDNAEQHEAQISREITKNNFTSQTLRPSNNQANGPSTSFTKKVGQKALVAVKRVEPDVPVYSDPVFGLRIVRPLVSSVFLKERMDGRTSISMATVVFHIERGDLSKDWVIAGVIVSKSPVKQTKKGDSFSIWRISDLKGDIKTVSLFLFRSGHKELWKTAVGSVVAILNPGVFNKRADSGDVACLTIDNAQKVMILGESKDFGMCKSRKKNGEPCTAIVNLTDCEFCVYHVKQEFNNMSRRSELQSATSGRGLQELRNKVLGKAEVFYGGKSYLAVPAKKSAKHTIKDENRLKSLLSGSPNTSGINANRSSLGPLSKIASPNELSNKQRQKDSERLNLLNNSQISDQLLSVSPIQSVPDKYETKQFSFSSQSVPKLSQTGFSIDIDFSKKRSDLAKIKAIDAIKKKPLTKTDPNSVRNRAPIEGKKRTFNELMNTDEKDEQKKRKTVEQDRRSRIEKIMEATSSHTNLINSREREEQDKYFNKLEKKEALEEKMLSTFKIACKAVICVQCKYTAFSAADRCKEERHTLKVIDAEKRFFQCQDCGNRTATVHRIPKIACKNCSGSRWQRTAMIRERKIHDGPELSVRGDEEKFIGSLASSASLNLLVPEE